MMGSLDLQCYGSKSNGIWLGGRRAANAIRQIWVVIMSLTDAVVALFLDRIDKKKHFFLFQLRFCLEFGKNTQ